MTKNQLTYWANVETERANRAREQENTRANLAKETELNRANLAKEANDRYAVAVNATTEQAKLGEANRHNLETERHNRAKDTWSNINDTIKVVTDIPVKFISAAGSALHGASNLAGILNPAQ